MAGALAGTAAIATTTPALAAGPCGTTTIAPTYKHVIWIWFENHSSSSIIGSSQAPYFNTIANECGLATNYHNLSHPSLPNYVGATSGLAYFAVLAMPMQSWVLLAADSYAHYASLPIGLIGLAALVELGSRSALPITARKPIDESRDVLYVGPAVE